MKPWIYFDAKYLMSELKLMFRRQYLYEDILAGAAVACIAIPLSLAIALASSVAPEIALTSAIIGGIVAAIFGGTRLGVTGPAVAMTVLIAQCVQNYGLAGLLITGLICGILQIGCGVLRLGRFTKLVPLPVISAFIAAIGFIILLGQLPNVFHLPMLGHTSEFAVIRYWDSYLHDMQITSCLLAISTVVILAVLARFFPKSPALLIAVIIPTAAVYLFDLPNVAVVGTMPHHLPIPHLPDFSAITNWKALISSALVIFTLASLETLLSCSAIEKMDKNLSHKPDQELIGQGLANIGVALFGGIPVTEVIARSSVNIHAGAKTRRSAIIHSLIILAVIYACPQLIEGIPIAVLAGILLSAALKMMNIRELINFWKNDKLEVAVYLTTFVTIVTTDLIDGIQTGIILALLIVAVRMLATKTSIKLWPNKQVLRISLGGNMTFWSFEKLNQIHQHIRQEPKLRFVVFEFESLNGIDSTGAKHLVDIAQEIAQHNIQVIFHGLTQEQERLLNTSVPEEKPFITTITESQIKQLMESSGITHSANDILKHGMEKFLDQYAHERQQLFDSLAKEQKPHTLLITCADSRLNPNAFFSVGLGEIFIVRNVGNVIPKFLPENKYSEGAAIEFALAGLTIRNVVICAHTECGAIKASLKDLDKPAQSGLDNWLQIIKDGFRQAKPQDIDEGVKVNLLNQVNNLKTYPLVIELLNKGELTISAWVYDVHSAQMLEWDNAQQQFLPILKDNLQVAAM